MDILLISVFFLIIFFLVNVSLLSRKYNQPVQDTSTHVKPSHVLYNLLKQYSSGDKLYLEGKCHVNLYTKHIIPVTLKEKFIQLINKIFTSIYGKTNELFQVQELNNIYEQIDAFSNKRYIVDATLNSTKNYYTARIILDIVIINEEIMVNFISVNTASNNNIIDRYDIVFQDQGILLNHNNFTSNIRSLLDQEYKHKHRLIKFHSKYLDSKNYEFENVLSLQSLLKGYLPSSLSSDSEKDLTKKGVIGQLESYFPSDLPVVDSPQFCDKYTPNWKNDGIPPVGKESCVFDHNSTETEYNQPYMGPGLFFNRSSISKP
jgi:hypothetical protein